jgi:hypothetical protein
MTQEQIQQILDQGNVEQAIAPSDELPLSVDAEQEDESIAAFVNLPPVEQMDDTPSRPHDLHSQIQGNYMYSVFYFT